MTLGFSWAGADVHDWLAVGALVAATVLCRACFLLPAREPRMPSWLRQGLRHAPLAALLAIVAPAVGSADALAEGPGTRWLALAACAAGYFGLGRSATVAMLAGTAAYLGTRLPG